VAQLVRDDDLVDAEQRALRLRRHHLQPE